MSKRTHSAAPETSRERIVLIDIRQQMLDLEALRKGWLKPSGAPKTPEPEGLCDVQGKAAPDCPGHSMQHD